MFQHHSLPHKATKCFWPRPRYLGFFFFLRHINYCSGTLAFSWNQLSMKCLYTEEYFIFSVLCVNYFPAYLHFWGRGGRINLHSLWEQTNMPTKRKIAYFTALLPISKTSIHTNTSFQLLTYSLRTNQIHSISRAACNLLTRDATARKYTICFFV